MDKTPAPRRTRHDGWTPDRQQRFIAALCYGLTVPTAAATVAMSARSAYRLRNHPAAAGFRAAWEAAVAPAIAPRGPDLLDKALARMIVPGRFEGEDCTINRPISTKQMLRLLDRGEAQLAKLQKRAKT
jgi:hypothetical protein